MLAMAVKVVGVVCIHRLLESFADPDRNHASFLDLDVVALIGSLCTALKLWLVLSWFPRFAIGLVVTVADKLKRQRFPAWKPARQGMSTH